MIARIIASAHEKASNLPTRTARMVLSIRMTAFMTFLALAAAAFGAWAFSVWLPRIPGRYIFISPNVFWGAFAGFCVGVIIAKILQGFVKFCRACRTDVSKKTDR
jgi:hypothetical protein